MFRWIKIAGAVVILAALISTGCEEWLVGAPCVSETEDKAFEATLTQDSYAIETRSVQCPGLTSICITATQRLERPNDDATDEFNKHLDTQAKYSFCSCRCRDADGHKYDKNSDKYDDLCECPGDTRCQLVLGKSIEGAPDKIKGSYCMPKCIAEKGSCDIAGGQRCTPSSSSDEPWKWKCREPSTK